MRDIDKGELMSDGFEEREVGLETERASKLS